MKISLSWLRKFVDVDILGVDPGELARALTMVGLAVDVLERKGDDWVFDVDVTTNRPDCLNHLGVARELAARFRLKLGRPDYSHPETDRTRCGDFSFEIHIEDPDLCPRYAGRVVTDVRVGQSPDWLKGWLETVGQRPINNVVDITNYILFELGHPLHAFDYSKLRGGRVVVRRARPGERLTTLDGIDRALDENMLMICDASSPVAVGGVMGGEESEVVEGTRTLLLESAFFQPASIRGTSKNLGLSTEASYRFERGADPEMPVRALNVACRLIEEVCGGRCVSPVIDVHPAPFQPRSLRLRPGRVLQVLGVDVPRREILEILEALEFQPVEDGEAGGIQVRVPAFRGDIDIEDDLVEEVARHFGYDRVPSRYPSPFGAGVHLPAESHERLLVDGLTGFGFSQAVNYAFASPEREARYGVTAGSGVALANPLTEVDTHLRTTLIPGLLDSVRHNLNHGRREIRLFEIGSVFTSARTGEQSLVLETPMLALAATGEFYNPFWSGCAEPFDFFHLKGMLEALLVKLGVEVEFRQVSGVAYLHPGVAAEIVVGENRFGLAGELHPLLRDRLKLPERLYYGEIDLSKVYAQPIPEPRFVAPCRFPSAERDLSFLLDKELTFGRIASAVQILAIPELRSFRLIDLYQGPNLPKDKVGLTVRLTFEDAARTLTQGEVSDRCEAVVSALRERFAVERR
jgi:phenylalanyl-tRNA synthetase beta chain